MFAARLVYWGKYATVYDLMLTFNPAYQELMADFRSEIKQWQVGPGDLIVDVGGGAGEAARAYPDARVLCLDVNENMLSHARSKADGMSAANISFVQADADEYPFAALGTWSI